jgi:hypothetical protein
MLKQVFVSNKKLNLIKNIFKFNFSNTNNDNKVSYVKVNDLKGFGKKFSEDEVQKYLDPFGFLGPNECNF